MASQSGLTPTADPQPTPTSGGPGRTTGASNLYLFTFLATLCVLLIVSCSIVGRSVVMRRRYQRRLTAAIASGRVLTPRAPGSRKRRFVEKPKFYDTWVTPGGVGWDTIMPVSVHVVSKAPPNMHPTRTSLGDRTSIDHVRPQQRQLSRRPSLFSVLSRSSDRRHTTASLGELPDDRYHHRRMQVSVLVAMPNPRTPSSTTDVSNRFSTINSSNQLEPDDIPNVVLGVADLTCTTNHRHSQLQS